MLMHLMAEGPQLATQARLVFLLVGPRRGGGAAVQTALDRHPKLMCAGDTLASQGYLNREEHERYFGPWEDVFDETDGQPRLNVERYLDQFLFNFPTSAHGLGIRLTYEQLAEYDLWDYWERRGREVGFCLLHITRNPLATFLSQRRAQQTGVWRCQNGDAPPRYPWSTNCDWSAEEVVDHVRQQDSWQARVERLCRDQLKIPYSSVVNFPEARHRLCEFMELPIHKIQPTTKPLGGVRALERISLEGLERLPPDVAHHLQHEFI